MEHKTRIQKGVKNQEGFVLSGMGIFFLVIVILTETLDTKKFTTKSMQEITMWEIETIMDIQGTIM